ncbi:MAG TPA: MBL fold metallo-hydrolase [Solirubrobacteraceae bacterium]|nr:MBL fold metallo-hydrolase [Solirubrobacteraceae bacterium]
MTRLDPAREVAERLTWLGHASVLLELSGARLLTDPVLRSRVLHLRRRAPEPAAPGALDAVLISHGHRDHLDLPSLRRVDPGAIVVTARGASRWLRRLGRAVVELAPGEEVRIGGVAVRAVPAAHDGRRSPIAARAGAVGFVVEGRRRVYFAGDTEVFPGMAGLAEDLDAALVPVWGWGPSLGAGHMNPAQAAEAIALLRPRHAVPIHWGTFLPLGLGRRHAHHLRDPPHEFAAHVATLAPATHVAILAPGSSLELGGKDR